MLLQFAPSLLQKFGCWPPISPTAHISPRAVLFSAGKLISRIDGSELGSFGHFACSFSLATFSTFPTFGALTTFATFGALSLASFGLTGLAFPHLARTGGLFLSGSALVPDVRRLGGNNGNMMLLLGTGQTTRVKLVGGVPTPLKNMRLFGLILAYGTIKFLFQTTNQKMLIEWNSVSFSSVVVHLHTYCNVYQPSRSVFIHIQWLPRHIGPIMSNKQMNKLNKQINTVDYIHTITI